MNDTPRHIIRRLAGDIVEGRLRAENGRLPAPGPPDDLADWLAKIGFDASPTAAESFFDVAARLCLCDASEDEGSRIARFTDLALACLDAPSPVSALTNLRRYLENAGSPAVFLDTIAQAPPLIEMLITTFGSSQYMADILIRTPGYVYWLMDGQTWEEPDTADSFTDTLQREAEVFQSAAGKLDAIRRAHRKALLKIGVRDLLGDSSTEQTALRLSNLADAVARVVLEVVADGAGGGFAVIALGKLGGRELNYSSDIDLLYVCEDTDDETTASYVKLARAFTAALTEVTAEGYLYRVDLRLRPDGQAGPLVNSESSMRVYYENRGRPWEFQAMLKARAIAGDVAMGRRLLNVVSSLVFNPSLSYTPLEDIARMRAQIRDSIPPRERAFNIKLMSGGIRDVEFTAQTFQLMHGHRHAELRTTNTLEALAQIDRLRLLKRWEVDNLAAAYRFFRLVEHRLQMMHQIKTHSVPESSEEIALLARRVSRGPLGKYTTASFLETLSKHLANVRTFSESFFAGEDVHPHSVLLLLPEDDDRANAIIAQYNITDVRRAMHVLHSMAYGSFPKLHDRATRSAFENLLPFLLEDSAETGDPDRTLVNVAQMAEASRSEASFYRLLTESPAARRRVVAVAGFSSYLTKRLCGQMEYFEPYIGEAMPTALETGMDPLDRPDRWITVHHDAVHQQRLADEQRERQRSWLDRVRITGFLKDHTRLRIAEALPDDLTRAVRALVSAVFENAIDRTERVALFSLGSFAVGEPRLLSDLDVIVVTLGADIPNTTVQVQRINRWLNEGNIVKLDFRLRGEGASAPLLQDLEFYKRYFETRMSLWERVAFAKCRFWWGDEELAEEFLRLLQKSVAVPFTSAEISSLMRSRKSIESLAPKAQRGWETKRSAGGRYDVEYLTAIGLAEATPGRSYDLGLDTLGRIALMRDHGALSKPECEALASALQLFKEVEYLIELQELSFPRSDERASEIERYLSRSFEYWGSPKAGGVAAALADAKASVRECFDRFMEKRV
jgi:glutamate-ammonia-ligase adenylyltransferase